MTINREKGYCTVECDICGDVHDEEFESFGAALDFVRRGPWVPETEDDGTTWTHRCPSCIPSATGSRLDRAKALFGE